MSVARHLHGLAVAIAAVIAVAVVVAVRNRDEASTRLARRGVVVGGARRAVVAAPSLVAVAGAGWVLVLLWLDRETDATAVADLSVQRRGTVCSSAIPVRVSEAKRARGVVVGWVGLELGVRGEGGVGLCLAYHANQTT